MKSCERVATLERSTQSPRLLVEPLHGRLMASRAWFHYVYAAGVLKQDRELYSELLSGSIVASRQVIPKCQESFVIVRPKPTALEII